MSLSLIDTTSSSIVQATTKQGNRSVQTPPSVTRVMLLLQLPAEILFQKFEDVGSHYFRSDIARLTVCKKWNAFARTPCFHDLQITTKTL